MRFLKVDSMNKTGFSVHWSYPIADYLTPKKVPLIYRLTALDQNGRNLRTVDVVGVLYTVGCSRKLTRCRSLRCYETKNSLSYAVYQEKVVHFAALSISRGA